MNRCNDGWRTGDFHHHHPSSSFTIIAPNFVQTHEQSAPGWGYLSAMEWLSSCFVSSRSTRPCKIKGQIWRKKHIHCSNFKRSTWNWFELVWVPCASQQRCSSSLVLNMTNGSCGPFLSNQTCQNEVFTLKPTCWRYNLSFARRIYVGATFERPKPSVRYTQDLAFRSF